MSFIRNDFEQSETRTGLMNSHEDLATRKDGAALPARSRGGRTKHRGTANGGTLPSVTTALSVVLFAIGCGGGGAPASAPAANRANSPPPVAAVAAMQKTKSVDDDHASSNVVGGADTSLVSSSSTAASVAATYAELVVRYRDLSAKELIDQARARCQPPAKLDFDPIAVDYYPEVARALQLTPEEQALYKQNGFVVVDHGRRYSMGSLYHAIYTRDLPVLVTSDSILHAFHRSFDTILRSLEEGLLLPGYRQIFEAMHQRLGATAAGNADPKLAEALGDVDVYLTVALNLLAGAGGPATATAPVTAPAASSRLANSDGDGWEATAPIPSKTGKDAEVLDVLRRIQRQDIELPDDQGRCSNGTPLRGSQRCVDYTQFIPRGHYTKSAPLKRYFRAMMWLGRADTGWVVAGGNAANLAQVPALRESRGAALLTLLIHEAGQAAALAVLTRLMDMIVGVADGATPLHMAEALKAAKVERLEDLRADTNVLDAAAALAKLRGVEQTIRSQTVLPAGDGQPATQPPTVLQLSGQRFVVDAFVLSKVVYDSIDFRGKKQRRVHPMGLDAMAALGSDEAVSLLAQELERYNYAANLLATRQALEKHSVKLFSDSLYGGWLGTLQTLHRLPSSNNVPKSMRSEAWQHKQLQTTLASWAELRHDTVLYAKQSYTASTLCEYPDGYVEPYPQFFAKVGALSKDLALRLSAVLGSTVDAKDSKRATKRATTVPRPGHMEQAFLKDFASTMAQLEQLANKELAGSPFTAEERAFLKKTIDIRGGGSGPPRYDGWYPNLFYDREPAKWEPTIADVHTSPGPQHPGVLEEAVGDANFLVIAVDNGNDRRVYVGPVYSYFEFVVPPRERLTDEDWQRMLEMNRPVPRPKWTKGFVAKPTVRAMGPAAARHVGGEN